MKESKLDKARREQERKTRYDLALRNKAETIKYIDTYIRVHKYAPSLREIMEHCNLKSTSPAQNRLNRLVDAGYLGRVPTKARALWVTRAGRKFVEDFENEIDQVTRNAAAEWGTVEW